MYGTEDVGTKNVHWNNTVEVMSIKKDGMTKKIFRSQSKKQRRKRIGDNSHFLIITQVTTSNLAC